jgi:hypothetical protein
MRLPLLILISTIPFLSRAQLAEQFADSNFTAAPPWTSTPGAWTVNAARQLQSVHTLPGSSFYLATPNTLATEVQWELWLRLAFATSSANYADIWILSASADPAAAGNTGYFVRVGGTQDEVALYRKDAGATIKLIDGADAVTAGSDNELRLRITRTGGVFRLQRAGTAGTYITEGTVADATYNSGAFFCLQVRQSTASFFGKHYFDDLSIKPFVADTIAPAIGTIRARSDTTLDLRFSEPVFAADAAQAARYNIAGLGAPVSAVVDGSDAALVHLRFATPFAAGRELLLTVSNIHDEWGNLLVRDTGSFLWYVPHWGDVVIHEIMADPEPAVGLPAAEWIELRNISGRTVFLEGWRIASETSSSAPLPDIMLPADSMLLLASSGNAAALMRYGRVAMLASFPALDNDGSTLTLRAADGRLIHAVAYSKDWYRDNVKDGGGWSLEMIDAQNLCGAAGNWRASSDPSGGTPGRRNSVAAVSPDLQAPGLLRAWCIDSLNIVAVFDESLDSISTATAHFVLTDGPRVTGMKPLGPMFREVQLQLATPLLPGKIYELLVEGPTDCAANSIATQNRTLIGLPERPEAGKLLLNELLYQPRTGGSEYVELFHNGTTPIDLSRCYLAGRNASGVLSNLKRITSTPLLLFPGDYAVCTDDPEAVLAQYSVARPQWLLPVPGMPALPDEGGSIVLLDHEGHILDEVHYDPGWQYALLHDTHGVALERLHPSGPTNDRHNWHSAAETSGFGTPTARNSQYRDLSATDGFLVAPHVFTPDGDGQDDLTFLEYTLDESGYMANISIFDASGMLCRRLVQNGLMGRSGSWHWDGTDDKGGAASAGIYVVLAELFNLEGKKRSYKKTVVLARSRH